MKFIPNPNSLARNEVAEIDDNTFFSYNEKPGMGTTMFAADKGGDETAMVLDGKYYILNGDFREAYRKAFNAGGVQACCKIYSNMEPEHGSSWSSGSDPIKALIGMIERMASTDS